MGSKSPDMPPSIEYQTPDPAGGGIDAAMETMNQQMQMMMELAAQPPALPEMPQPTQVQSVDWEAKREALRAEQAKVQEEYAKKRKGITSTILTNAASLLNEDDEELPDLLTSVLSSGVGGAGGTILT